MSDNAAREMTLDEWVERLPTIHRARKELAELCAAKAAAEQEVERLKARIAELETTVPDMKKRDDSRSIQSDGTYRIKDDDDA